MFKDRVARNAFRVHRLIPSFKNTNTQQERKQELVLFEQWSTNVPVDTAKSTANIRIMPDNGEELALLTTIIKSGPLDAIQEISLALPSWYTSN